MDISEPNPRLSNEARTDNDDGAQAGRTAPAVDRSRTTGDGWDADWNIVRGED